MLRRRKRRPRPGEQAAREARVLCASLAAFAGAATREAIEAALLDGVGALGAEASALFYVEGRDLLLRKCRGCDAPQRRELAALGIDTTDHPVAEAARTLRVVHAESPTAAAHAAQSGLALPLLRGPELLGVVYASFPSRAARRHEVKAVLESLSASCAAALERAARYELLEQRLREEEHLLGIASHDLRSPLHLISMASEVLASQATLAAEQQNLLARIGDSAQRASAMVWQLLDFTKVQLTGLTVSTEQADLFELLRDCVSDFRVRAPDCPLTLSLEGNGCARVDRDRFVQVVHNLVANAVVYRERGSGVEVRGQGQSARVYIEVHNRGPAIAPELLSDLFSPLRRGADRAERGSLGLGLFIVKRLVEAHGGRVWARSDAEEGTTFVVELLREPQVDEVPLLSPPSEPPAPLVSGGALPEEYAALHRALGEGPLQDLLTHWLELGGGVHLPHPRSFDRARFSAFMPDIFRVEVLPPNGHAARFRFEEVGGALERRLDSGPLRDSVAAPAEDALRSSMFAAYERCLTRRRPVFDYLRTHSRHPPEMFSRLVLPFSRNSVDVTHLIGMARFTGFPEARAGASSSR